MSDKDISLRWSDSERVLRVGDRIFWSLERIQAVKDEGQMLLLEVENIRDSLDGHKVVTMKRVEPPA